MVSILGIKPSLKKRKNATWWGGHNPGACLVENGEIIAAAEEERFNRIKRSPRPNFPKESIKFVLNFGDKNISDVDAIAIGRDHHQYIENYNIKSFIPGPSLASVDNVYGNMKKYYNIKYSEKHMERLKNKLKLEFNQNFPGEFVEISHHRCHAASAYYCSDLDDCVVMTMDGKGETESTVFWDSELNRIKEFPTNNSLGHFYSTGAKYLGFRGSRDAGKVMGLAPYGDYRDEFEKAFNELTNVNHKNGHYDVTKMDSTDYGLLEDKFGSRRVFPEEFAKHHKDFAYHLQKRLEEIVKGLVQYLTNETGKSEVAFAGGVAMNCKLNREVLNMEPVNELFIQPAANDSGICIGAALEGYRQITGKKPDPDFNHVYYGPEYADSHIKNEINLCKLDCKKLGSDEIIKKAADLLAEDNIIGWYQGRMEFGPRALGNRSILANPTSADSLDRVNTNVKNRENWRPFAPSLLYEAKDEYLIEADEAPYMILLDSVEESKHDEVPAITHVDGTTRPQTVRKSQNERYWKLIKELEKRTGVPVVLNTSFNVSGEPIVESPKQAIADFYTTGLDALILGDYLFTK